MQRSVFMPKGKTDDTLELDFGKTDEREFTGSDANPKDAATGESLFEELSPRFIRQVDAELEKQAGKKPKTKPKADDDESDPSDEDFEPEADEEEEADEGEELDPSDEPNEDEPEEGEEDDDEPRRRGESKSAFEKRLARADRIIDETRTQLAEMAARENAREAKDRLAASEGEFTKFETSTQSKLKSLKALKVKAIEDGDTAAQVDLDDQITDLKAELSTKRNSYETGKKALEESTKARGASSITVTKANQWKRKNPRYTSDPEFAEVVNGIDRSLITAGSNPESDAHYAAIDARVRKLFPTVRKPVRKHPSSQVPREGSIRQQSRGADTRVEIKGNKIKIAPGKLAKIKANMVRFGLDPENKKDLFDHIQNNPGI